ncbi:MAG: YIP1 family protein [Deltaproteobacteria bacterium]|jgi:hypothetical protein
MEDSHKGAQMDVGKQVKAIPATAFEVIANPGGFYRNMPKEGGFLPPLIFMVTMGVAGGLLQTILALAGLVRGSMFSSMAALILMPLLVGIFSFVGAAVLYGFWKILGSRESFETAFRCGAYAAAILPFTTFLDIIPYLGSVLGLAWMTFLLVAASIKVHGIAAKKAWIAFGTICAVIAVSSVSMEMAARRVSSRMENRNRGNQAQLDKLNHLDEMSPEEAGKTVGQFLKGFGQVAQEKK